MNQAAGAPGSPGGTSRVPSALRPKLVSLDCMSELGISMDIGTEAAMTSADETGAATVDGDVLRVSIVVSRALTVCVEAVDAQPVRSSKATAAEAKHLRRPLVELVIRRISSKSSRP